MPEPGDRVQLTRREVLGGMLGVAGMTSAIAAAPPGAAAPGSAKVALSSGVRSGTAQERWDTVVVGAGVFGAWTAWHLLQQGKKVLLVDAWGPAHARASSGGESRMTRTTYGGDELYTRMAWDSLDEWRWLSERSGLPVFHATGVLFFFPKAEPYFKDSVEVHRRLGLPLETLDRAALAKRYPQIGWEGIEHGLFEPDLGVLMARRAVQTLVKEFVAAGGSYRHLGVRTPHGGKSLDRVETLDGATLRANAFVFACGPWLPKLFPEVLGARIFPTRQEVFFFAPEAGDTRFQPSQLPGWADFNDGDIFYGMPDLEARGFKIAHDRHGPAIDPDVGDRKASEEALAEARAYMQRRFPALAKRPLVEARVCQYENSSNGDLLIDRHPALDNVWLVGAGSGHGFKHGPAVGRYAANMVNGRLPAVEPRFSVASKQQQKNRAVH